MYTSRTNQVELLLFRCPKEGSKVAGPGLCSAALQPSVSSEISSSLSRFCWAYFSYHAFFKSTTVPGRRGSACHYFPPTAMSATASSFANVLQQPARQGFDDNGLDDARSINTAMWIPPYKIRIPPSLRQWARRHYEHDHPHTFRFLCAAE